MLASIFGGGLHHVVLDATRPQSTILLMKMIQGAFL
jgi:hypothetical protein